MEDKEGTEGNAGEPGTIISVEGLAEIGDGENKEDRELNEFLNGFQLRAGVINQVFSAETSGTGGIDSCRHRVRPHLDKDCFLRRFEKFYK